jgi:large subunit ribosomal protein L32e
MIAMKRVSGDKLSRAIKEKSKISSERPEFHRSEYTRFPRLGDKWRSSKGIRSKMRLKKRSRAAIVETGYRGPSIARGLRHDGKSEVLVYRVQDLKQIDPVSQDARIGGVVGRRKRLEIIAKAEELKITILNIRRSDLKPSKVEEKAAEEKPEELEEAVEPTEEEEGMAEEEVVEKAEEQPPEEEKTPPPVKEKKQRRKPKAKPKEEEIEEEPEEPESEEPKEEAESEEETEE